MHQQVDFYHGMSVCRTFYCFSHTQPGHHKHKSLRFLPTPAHTWVRSLSDPYGRGEHQLFCVNDTACCCSQEREALRKQSRWSSSLNSEAITDKDAGCSFVPTDCSHQTALHRGRSQELCVLQASSVMCCPAVQELGMSIWNEDIFVFWYLYQSISLCLLRYVASPGDVESCFQQFYQCFVSKTH